MPSRQIDRALVLAPSLALMLSVPLLPIPACAQPKAAEMPLDEVGYAAVLDGTEPGAVRGAHRALPVPSYVEVTALATGRTILVEISRKGADAPGEVIALSCGAVGQLGLTAIPSAVRVRRVSPPDQERDKLSQGHPAAARLDAPEGLLSALRRKLPPAPRSIGGGDCGVPSGTTQPRKADNAVPPEPSKSASSSTPIPAKVEAPKRVPPPSAPSRPVALKPAPLAVEKPRPPVPAMQPAKGPGYIIQVAALSNRAKAGRLAQSVGGHVESAGSVFRVRKGPYPSEVAARAALPAIRAKGFADARIMPNEGR